MKEVSTKHKRKRVAALHLFKYWTPFSREFIDELLSERLDQMSGRATNHVCVAVVGTNPILSPGSSLVGPLLPQSFQVALEDCGRYQRPPREAI